MRVRASASGVQGLLIYAYRGRVIAQLCAHLRPDLVHEFRRN
jgi:hypothetical protein